MPISPFLDKPIQLTKSGRKRRQLTVLVLLASARIPMEYEVGSQVHFDFMLVSVFFIELTAISVRGSSPSAE